MDTYIYNNSQSDKDSVNYYLDTYGFRRGRYYGWFYMNYPTQMATSNIVFSNIFDTNTVEKELRASTEGLIFTDFNPFILVGGVAVLLVVAITVPLVIRKKRKSRKGENVASK